MELIYTMEIDPKIKLDTPIAQIKSDLEKRLGTNSYHTRTESAANSVLNMMLKKTQMYGGNDTSKDEEFESLDRGYFELMRKANRLNSIRKQIKKGNESAKAVYLDTILDIVGYGLISLVDLSEELQE